MLNFPTWKIILVVVVCLAGIAIASPNFLPKSWTGDGAKVNLGLDLRGGSYLLLEVDVDSYINEQMHGLLEEARMALRKDKIGYQNLSVRDRKVTFTLRDSNEADKVKDSIRNISIDIATDISSAGEASLSYRDDYIKKMEHSVVNQSIEIVRRRVDETGTREPIIQRQGDKRILLQVPGLDNPERLKTLLGKTAKMTFHLMDETNPFPEAPISAPPGTVLLKGDSSEDPSGGRYYLIQKRAILTGDMLVDSAATFDQGMPVVSFRFNNLGGKKFADVTKDNVGKPFAIVLDDKVVSAPYIEEPILGGSGIIRGRFTTQQVQDTALLLRAGALPAPLSVVEERTVGPSLGQDSITSGIKAAVVGFILVVGFMLYFYGFTFGGIASIALVFNMILLVACLSLFQATLTLPGIAGIILTMGMAVDANVLIFERMREEIKAGKTPYAVIDQGYSQAMSTILDSNITTLIATFLLYAYGTGPVKGFAVTLTMGILCSMFSAVMLSRLLIALWMKKKKPTKLPI